MLITDVRNVNKFHEELEYIFAAIMINKKGPFSIAEKKNEDKDICTFLHCIPNEFYLLHLSRTAVSMEPPG